MSACCAGALWGAEPVTLDYSASLTANASTGSWTPYMLGSWNYGRITGADGLWHDGRVEKKVDTGRRFSWGAGVEYLAGYGTGVQYDRYDRGEWTTHKAGQAPLRLHQLYGEVKYRGVYLLVGMKERHSGIVDDDLSSGDLTRSNNSRPIPGVAAGFIDFQDIPFTNGWVQIDGEIMYGRMTDGGFKDKLFNRYSGELARGLYYTYKRCYFRTKPAQPLSVTVGMQAGGLFGGTTQWWRRGEVVRTDVRGFHVRDIWEMFFPMEGGEDYYKGSSLGSWDFKARYRLRDGSELKAYFEWPWEDGSGIGRRNGWDGVWGLQYDFAHAGAVSKIVVEYIDFTNQGGPIHFAPGDYPGIDITSQATGGDNYYNNDYYGPYSYYGMSIGSPFVVSPLYNADGTTGFEHNRARGFHVAVTGNVLPQLSYKAMAGYQRAGGTGRVPARERLSCTSAKLAACWRVDAVKGLSVDAAVAFDAGKLRGNNFGAMISVKYSGKLSLGKK